MKKDVAILHFGGSRLRIVVGAPGVNGSFIIKKRVDAAYSGIVSGEFVSQAELGPILADVIEQAFAPLKKSVGRTGKKKVELARVEKLYIGVPHVFCDCVTKNVEISFDKPRKIGSKEIRDVFGSVQYIDSTRTIINKSAVFYKLDDGRAIIDATGCVCKKISARISLITCANSFINTVRSCLYGTGVKRIEFISAALAECLYLIDEDSRDKTAVMITANMTSTSVSVVSGDGLVYLKSFDQGAAHVINDISVVLGTTFPVARALVGEAIVSVKMSENDNYQIVHNDKKMKFAAATVNDIIKSRMEVMAENVLRLIKAADITLLKNPIYICGGNLDAVSGSRDFLSKAIGAHVFQCVCPFTKQNKPSELTIAALLNLAIAQER